MAALSPTERSSVFEMKGCCDVLGNGWEVASDMFWDPKGSRCNNAVVKTCIKLESVGVHAVCACGTDACMTSAETPAQAVMVETSCGC